MADSGSSSNYLTDEDWNYMFWDGPVSFDDKAEIVAQLNANYAATVVVDKRIENGKAESSKRAECINNMKENPVFIGRLKEHVKEIMLKEFNQ